VNVSSLDFAYGDRFVVREVNFVVAGRQRLALVGENGSGKSTVLRVLAGELDHDGGSVRVAESCELLAQETSLPLNFTVDQVLEAALAPVRALEAELDQRALELERDPHSEDVAVAYAQVLARAEFADVWNASVRVAEVLSALDLDSIERSRTLAQMSGGQVRRFALAAVLIRRPTVMLLDEPTNHVDDAGLVFLQETLKHFPGAVVMSSHDREFLNQTATGIYDLDPFDAALRARARGASEDSVIKADSDKPSGFDERYYRGDYSEYVRAKRQERKAWEARYRSEQEQLEWLSTTGDSKARDVKHRERRDGNKMGYGMRGNRVDKQVSRRIKAAAHRYEVLEREAVGRPPVVLSLDETSLAGAPRANGSDGPSSAEAVRPRPQIKLVDAQVEGRLAPLNLVVRSGEKILVTGSNGTGKSTLLSLLAGDSRATAGEVLRVRGLNVALLEQEVGLESDERTPREVYNLVAAHIANAPDVLEFGLLSAQDVDRPLMELSAGVRRRVVLQLLIVQRPDVLLLDEPTNHLSLVLIEELTQAIAAAQMTVVVATHDRWMRSTWPKSARKVHLEANV